jgi:hypothetical protein
MYVYAHQHNHLMFVKFVETSKEFDKERPGAEAQAKQRAKSYRATMRMTKRLEAEVTATLRGMTPAETEVVRAAALAQGWMPSSFF